MAIDHSPTPGILQRALQWLGVLRTKEVTPTERRQWLAWLDASPQQHQT
jgi:ferric-dicitrate binding protein FerR (iron transport regulator)